MTASSTRGIAATWLAAALVTACRSATQGPIEASPQPARGVEGELSAVAKAQADSARYAYTEADIRFMSGMISHHAQAILVAGWVESHGASASVQRLAARIINAQQDEIVLMQQWLRDRRQPVPEPNPAGRTMVRNGTEHLMLMPGMLTQAQMAELDRARGEAFDRLFLTYMIQHHRGAVTMVQTLIDSPGAAHDETVFKFAADVNVDQSTEIARMERMLAALPPEKPSP
jgi:uncharacterized protein (DUF305 family)